MLEIKGLYKEQHHTKLNHIDLSVYAGVIASIECRIEYSDLLFKLILGKVSPAKGKIRINGHNHIDYIIKHLGNIGIVMAAEGLYERMTVGSYLRFYRELLGSRVNSTDVMMKLGLLDIVDKQIDRLTFPQKKRLGFARERLKDIQMLFFQEPLANIDNDSARMIIENIEELRLGGVAVICTSSSYKEALLIGGQTYLLDESGLEEVDHEKKTVSETDSSLNAYGATELQNEAPHYRIEKIPAKMDDTILLFNPTEIEYIESEKSISYLTIRGERFISTLTLGELESRLEYLGFFRCHRAYLVNLQRVREIITWSRNSYSLVLDDKKKSAIPLSKGRIDELKKILNL